MRRLVEHIGLPLGVVLLGYGSLALTAPGADSLGPLRLMLHFTVVLLVGRVGMLLGLNRTAALLAGLFYAASPLAACALVPGEPLVNLVWACLVLGVVMWWLSLRRPGPVGLFVMMGVLLTGAVVTAAMGEGPGAGGLALGRVPRDILMAGARFVLPAPAVREPSLSAVAALMLGAVVWGFWILMAVHRALLDNPLPRNLLILSWVAIIPTLGHPAAPSRFLLPLVMFAFFLMGFLRPSKLVDSPRILMMAAFFLVLLARTTATILA